MKSKLFLKKSALSTKEKRLDWSKKGPHTHSQEVRTSPKIGTSPNVLNNSKESVDPTCVSPDHMNENPSSKESVKRRILNQIITDFPVGGDGEYRSNLPICTDGFLKVSARVPKKRKISKYSANSWFRA